MIEGLWIVRFLQPDPDKLGILNGVVVIETGRILGGDSGYTYIGTIEEKVDGTWPVALKLSRHDDRIESIFGDASEYELAGCIREADEEDGPSRLVVELGKEAGQTDIVVQLTKAAELP